MTNNENIKKKILKYDYISFDVFDTLIKRLVNNPIQLFDIVEKEYNKEKNEKINDFKEKRLICEKEIVTTIPNLDEIYSKMNQYYSQ